MKIAAFRLMCVLWVLGAGVSAARAADDAVPAFTATGGPSGVIKIWGSPADRALLNDWADGFKKFHPDAQIVTSLHGPDSTLAGVYTGVADLAFMAREMKLPVEHMAFTWVYRYPAFSLEIANAGIGSNRLATNLAVFVNRRNPLTGVTLAQLDAILGAEHRRGDKNIRVWGDLGLDGAWKDRPVHVYGPVLDSVAALYIRRTVLKDSYKWNPGYRELADDGGEVLTALASDSAGIAYAPMRAPDGGVKPLALANDDGGPFVDLTAQTVSARSYPLTRVVTMVLNRAPGKPVEPRVKEFLRFILSREGQDAIARDGAYVPLSAANLRQQLERLD
jgi:phosphate transport system substrate-binding protein